MAASNGAFYELTDPANSLWRFDPTEAAPAEQQARQDRRQHWFAKIAPTPNWKEPIDVWIHESEVAQCSCAAVWFTGAPLRVIEAGTDGLVRVVAPGYYATIGA